MKKVKIRIVKAPTMAYGGQTGWGLDLNSRRTYVEGADGPQDSVSRTLGPVDREDATYEAERGEVIVGDMDRDGRQEMMTFGGKPHSQGGTPAKEDGFIFSKTKGMALRGPIVEKFGKTAGTKYTPADLAKQYDLSKYKAVLDDPKADDLSKKTAQMMYDNYQSKLADLAMVQESMKGFPQGIPQIAAEKYGQSGSTDIPAGPMAAYGGMYKMQDAGQTLPSWFKPWTQSKTVKGRTSPTGKITTYDPAVGNVNYDDYNYWRNQNNNADFNNLESMQGFMFDKIKAENPEAYQKMVNEWGMPAAGRFNDGIMGARSAAAMKYRTVAQQPTADPQDKPAAVVTQTPDKKISIDDYNRIQGEDPNFRGYSKGQLPYNRFDMANLAMAAATPVKSYAPRMFLPDVQEIQGYYDQPDYNPMLSQANTRMQMNNTFGNTGAAMAANTYNPELIQGILQETNRARTNNLQTANGLSQANTQIRNQANLMNAQLQQDNYDKWVKTQEETDIANKLKWRKDVAPAAMHMEKNRINMEKWNAMYPQYDVTGNDWRINVTGGKNYGDKATANAGTYGLKEFFAENPDLKAIYERGDDAKKLEIAKMVAARAREQRAMYTKNPKYMTANMNNQYLGSMMGMPQVGPYGAAGYDYDE